MKKVILSLALLLPLASAGAQDMWGPIELPPPLERILRDYERGWRGGHADSLAGLFTPDGFILRPGHEPVRGRAGIEQAYAGAGGPLRLSSYAFGMADSVGFIIGGFRYSVDPPDTGKFTLTLRLSADGRWLIASDMDNGNR